MPLVLEGIDWFVGLVILLEFSTNDIPSKLIMIKEKLI